MSRLQRILGDALQLPEEERLILAEQLIASLCDNATPEIEASQLAEVQRRIEEVRTGRVRLVPGEIVLPEVRDAVSRKK